MSAGSHGKKRIILRKICLDVLLNLVTLLVPSHLYPYVSCVLSDPTSAELEALDVLRNHLGAFVDGRSIRGNALPGREAQDGATYVPSNSDGCCNMLMDEISPRRCGKRRVADIVVQAGSSKKRYAAAQPSLTSGGSHEGYPENPQQRLVQVTIQKRPKDLNLNDPIEEMEENGDHPHVEAPSQEIAHLDKAHGSPEQLWNSGVKAETERRGQTFELRQFSLGRTPSPASNRRPTPNRGFDLNSPPDDTPEVEAIAPEPTPNYKTSPVTPIHRDVDGAMSTTVKRTDSNEFLQQSDKQFTNVKIGGMVKIPTANDPIQTNTVDLKAPQSQTSGLRLIHKNSPTSRHRPKNVAEIVFHSGNKGTPGRHNSFPGTSKGLRVVICQLPSEYKKFRSVWLPACHHSEVNRPKAIRDAGTQLGENVIVYFSLDLRQKGFHDSLRKLAATNPKYMSCENRSMPTDMDRISKMAMHKIYLIVCQVFSKPLFGDAAKLKSVHEKAHDYVIRYTSSLVEDKNNSKVLTERFSEISETVPYRNMRWKAHKHFERIAHPKKKKQVDDLNSFAWAIAEDWMQTNVHWVYNAMKFKDDLNQFFRLLVDDYAIALSGYTYKLHGERVKFEFRRVLKLKTPPKRE